MYLLNEMVYFREMSTTDKTEFILLIKMHVYLFLGVYDSPCILIVLLDNADMMGAIAIIVDC